MCVVRWALVGKGCGIAPIRSWHVSHQRMKGGKTNREKDEEATQRTLVDKGPNKSFFSGCLFEHGTEEKEVTVGFKGGVIKSRCSQSPPADSGHFISVRPPELK